MKRRSHGVALTLGLTLVLGVGVPVYSGMMGQRPMGQPEGATESSPGGMMGMMGQGGQGGMGMMGPQMMRGGMQDRPEGMGMHRPSQMIRLMKQELGLSDEQAKQAKAILSQVMKTNIRQHADLRIAELELQELLEAEPVDMGQIEAKLKAIEGLRTALRLNVIKAHEQVKAMLTPEQLQKLERLHDRMPGMMGPGMLSMIEMMGEGGPGGMGVMGQGGQGGMGMMGPQMMQQMMRGMMGGGMGGQPQSGQQTAAMPQNLTQQDAQGTVTVEVTLLTPDKPRADGKLAVQVKLDTHAVDLDQYQLEKLAVLRDAQGREISALGLESPSGSGHHRGGVLTFPGTDASGKPVLGPEAKALTLILRGIGGVPERVFRWQLPLG
ncbi:MAG TPA: periplasmic heavy metal sensor [Alphaproteobacteria bacterium]|nr:periplasmic heavy metal sensor [Alphaproteobacteria bacterium]